MDETNARPQTSHNNLEPHRGTLILVLGILSLVMCGFLLEYLPGSWAEMI